jgi:hypothetical protein
MAHTSTYAANHYVYEQLTPEKRLDHWRKRFQLGSVAFLQDGELMEQLGGQEEFLKIGQRSFNSYTFTRFHEIADRYGLVTGDRADCIEGVNLATIWTTYYHLPEDILTLDPNELWVRKYDCSAGWLSPPLCSWCWGMKSAILRIINPRLSFAWTKVAGMGFRFPPAGLAVPAGPVPNGKALSSYQHFAGQIGQQTYQQEAPEGTREGTSRYEVGLFGTPCDADKSTSDREVVGSSPAGGASGHRQTLGRRR